MNSDIVVEERKPRECRNFPPCERTYLPLGPAPVETGSLRDPGWSLRSVALDARQHSTGAALDDPFGKEKAAATDAAAAAVVAGSQPVGISSKTASSSRSSNETPAARDEGEGEDPAADLSGSEESESESECDSDSDSDSDESILAPLPPPLSNEEIRSRIMGHETPSSSLRSKYKEEDDDLSSSSDNTSNNYDDDDDDDDDDHDDNDDDDNNNNNKEIEMQSPRVPATVLSTEPPRRETPSIHPVIVQEPTPMEAASDETVDKTIDMGEHSPQPHRDEAAVVKGDAHDKEHNDDGDDDDDGDGDIEVVGGPSPDVNVADIAAAVTVTETAKTTSLATGSPSSVAETGDAVPREDGVTNGDLAEPPTAAVPLDDKDDDNNNNSVHQSADDESATSSSGGGGGSSNKNNKVAWEKPSWTTETNLRPSSERKSNDEDSAEGNPKEYLFDLPDDDDDEGMLNHVVVSEREPVGWEKPSWTRSKILSPTEKGAVLKERGDLAKPITTAVLRDEIPRLDFYLDSVRRGAVNREVRGHGKNKQKDDGAAARLAALDHRRIRWEKPSWTINPPLTPTRSGALLRNKIDLANPITPVPSLAEPPLGEKPENPASPAQEEADATGPVEPMDLEPIAWKKPEWTRNPPLTPTKRGATLKVRGCLAKPITPPPVASNTKDTEGHGESTAWERPLWTREPPLTATAPGAALRSGNEIARPITFPNDRKMDDDHDEPSTNSDGCPSEPSRIESIQGDSLDHEVRENRGLGGGSPDGDDVAAFADSSSSPDEAQGRESTTAWTKPEWTRKLPLKPTEKGYVLREQGDLAKPITTAVIRDDEDDRVPSSPTAWTKPSWTSEPPLNPTTAGRVIKSGKEIARPITFPNGRIED